MVSRSIQRKMDRATTVADLIEELQNYPQDALVFFGCDYGDICHTEQALPVHTVAELEDDEVLEESAYSKSGLAIEKLEDNWEKDEDNPKVVVLR